MPSVKGGYVYIMANRYRGGMYVGVSASIGARSFQHKTKSGSAYCRKWGHTRLVYMERHDEIEDAIVREKRIKKWNRAWKLRLIEGQNPDWEDLFEKLNG